MSFVKWAPGIVSYLFLGDGENLNFHAYKTLKNVSELFQ